MAKDEPLAWQNRLSVCENHTARSEQAKEDLADAIYARRKAIQDARRLGVTCAAIGRQLGVSRQRVSQIARGK